MVGRHAIAKGIMATNKPQYKSMPKNASAFFHAAELKDSYSAERPRKYCVTSKPMRQMTGVSKMTCIYHFIVYDSC